MKAKTRFLKMFYKLPEKARRELVFQAYESTPMTLNIIVIEVQANTTKGLNAIKKLGFKDD